MSDDRRILGIETSCDESSAAVLDGAGRLLGHVIHSQDVHQIYGGVVPELAARAHLQRLDAVVDQALLEAGHGLHDLDAIAVTAGPGLIGALLVGVCWAKGAAWSLDIPVVGVHHMEAHLFGPVLEDPEAEPPFIGLLVSGGHTLLLWVPEWGRYHLLGETRDDAAGEAFDKVAKLLGLSYPGGPAIQKVAEGGDPSRHRFPRPMLRGGAQPGDDDYWDLSFSGLKTAVANRVREIGSGDRLAAETPHVAAAFQEAVVDVLASKTMRAVEATGCRRVLVGGGVSANRPLREELEGRLGSSGTLLRASPRLSLDNGAMVARAGLFRLDRDGPSGLELGARADLPFPGLVRGLSNPTSPPELELHGGGRS